MLSDVDKKKKRAELLRVQAAKEEMEIFILEKQNEIKRVIESIEVQSQKEAELLKILNGGLDV
jgi:hypothetical protein